MATFAAHRLHTMLANSADIVAIDLLAAAQGIEFHRPKKSSPPIEKTIAAVRSVSPAYEEDRSLSRDIARLAAMINSGEFCEHAASVLPSLGA
jgi:histidine ammonia-lyase